jgi:hypothetical protein
MLLIDKIIPFYFFIALFIGFLLTYSFTPPPKIVYKYPTPDNKDKLVYKDDVNNCYKYKTTNVKCPKDEREIHEIPVQKLSED